MKRGLIKLGLAALALGGLARLFGRDDDDPIDQARPVSGAVFSTFRSPSRPGHNGVDLEGDDGEPVLAVWPGTVQFVQTPAQWANREPGPGRDAGAYVEITHDVAELPDALRIGRLAGVERVVTRYMHLDGTAATVGQRVAAGDVIGTLGRTGVETSRTHLHFEVRLGGMPPQRYGDAIDPMTLGVV